LLKSWKVALLLSIVLPMGLLTTFRLSGILKEPLTISENKTLDAVSLSMERPASDINIKDSLIKVYDEDVLANFTVFIDDYHADKWAYGGSDIVTTQISITSSVGEGYLSFVNITFWEDYMSSQIDFFNDKSWPKDYVSLGNLSIIRHKDFRSGCGLKAFVEMSGVNYPKSVSFSCFAHWVLRSPENYTHQLEVRFEIVYFNGTAYKRLVQPCLLKIRPDDNNSFEKAEEIATGKTYLGYIGPNDVDDYYRVYLNGGSTVSIKLKGIAPPALCDLEFYDIDGKLAAYSKYDVSHNITYAVSSSGYWLIKVHCIVNHGFYNLTVETHNQEGVK